MRKTARITGGVAALLLVAACSEAEAETEPTPTATVTETADPQPAETVTETATPEPESSVDNDWLVNEMASMITIEDMRDILVTRGLDCPNEQADANGMTLDCESSEHNTMIVRPFAPGASDRLEDLESVEGLGAVATENFVIMTDDIFVVDKAAIALGALSPVVDDP